MSSDLQRDIALVQATIARGAESAAPFEAWNRIKARLAEQGSAAASIASSPDRERVADAIWNATGCVLCDVSTYKAADAAIAAMGETP